MVVDRVGRIRTMRAQVVRVSVLDARDRSVGRVLHQRQRAVSVSDRRAISPISPSRYASLSENFANRLDSRFHRSAPPGPHESDRARAAPSLPTGGRSSENPDSAGSRGCSARARSTKSGLRPASRGCSRSMAARKSASALATRIGERCCRRESRDCSACARAPACIARPMNTS